MSLSKRCFVFLYNLAVEDRAGLPFEHLYICYLASADDLAIRYGTQKLPTARNHDNREFDYVKS